MTDKGKKEISRPTRLLLLLVLIGMPVLLISKAARLWNSTCIFGFFYINVICCWNRRRDI